MFCKKGVLKIFEKVTGKHLCQSLRPATLLKKRLWHSCFPVNLSKFLRTPFLKEHLWWLLLKISVFQNHGIAPDLYSFTFSLVKMQNTSPNLRLLLKFGRTLFVWNCLRHFLLYIVSKVSYYYSVYFNAHKKVFR